MPLFSPSIPPFTISQVTSTPLDRFDAKFDEAVGEENAGARFQVLGKRRKTLCRQAFWCPQSRAE